MLLAAFLGGRLGVLERLWLSKQELQGWLGKPAKTAGTRLAELCRKGFAQRTPEGNYQLTTYGVKHLIEVLLPDIRRKL
jgi:DNA-binding IclR family transcriptional regulator